MSFQLDRLKKDWDQIAQEDLKLEKITNSIYAFGSELGTLRLFKHYTGVETIAQGYSTNLKAFYFRLTMKSLGTWTK